MKGMLSGPRFSEGDNVRYIGTDKIGTINKVLKGSRSYSYKVTINGKPRTILERFLEPILDTEESIIEDIINGKFGNSTDYNLFQTWFRLSKPLESNLYSYLGSKTVFNPHQFKPLLRFLSVSSEERLYIADEVGVGKTIETGIILMELMARGQLDYYTPILVVCPHALGPKWVKEMKERFRLNFHFHNGKSLRYMLKTALRDSFFPQGYIFSVVGLQLIRCKEYMDMLRELDAKRDAPLFGIVIVDEAHHLRNPETDSNQLGNLLSCMTERMLMLSATPLNLRNEDLFNQMHILNPTMFPDMTIFETLQSPVRTLNKIRRRIATCTPDTFNKIITHLKKLSKGPLGNAVSSHPAIREFRKRLNDKTPFSTIEAAEYERLFISLSPLYYSFTRTRKREALDHQVQREVWELPVQLTREEMKFHDDVVEAVKNNYLSKGGDPAALGFVINMPRRMVSSCIPAMMEYLEWCIRENRIIENQVPEEAEDDSQLTTTELDPQLKQEFLRLLSEAKYLETVDSKFNQFKQLLEKIVVNPETSQVIVFSFFVRTLKYLKRRLEEEGFSVGLIHGEVPLQGNKEVMGRYEIMDSFEKEDYQILLSSEVGGEGLDFQYCHAIINYDLPYNPMRIEQRIGRIDRFGQKADKIIVGNLFIKETVDEEIYDRLYRRIRLVEDGVGALEPILGKELSDIQTAIITGTLTEEQKEKSLQRIERAVAEAKLEMEEFEKHREELLGDDYLIQPINNITKGDFVSPHDAMQLAGYCLSKWEGCNFIPTNPNCAKISLSNDTLSEMEQFLRRPGNEGGYNELQPLLSKEQIKAVFDGSIAHINRDHAFLAPTGYWTKFLIDRLEQEDAIVKTFRFGANPSEIDMPEGDYLVYLFEVRIEGFRTEIEFWGIPVDTATGSVLMISYENLPRLLADTQVDYEFSPGEIDPHSLFGSAREVLEEVLEKKRKIIEENNQYRVESRIAALKRSSEIKTRNLANQIKSHKKRRVEEGKEADENYLRLTEARITKEKTRLQSKVVELQTRHRLTIDFNLEAVIYLRVYSNGDGGDNHDL
jgi:superfamily II DNA or RNA helicase